MTPDKQREDNPYDAICIEGDCFAEVHEDDIARDPSGRIYERSKKCWNCRSASDRAAIKKWRRNHKQQPK